MGSEIELKIFVSADYDGVWRGYVFEPDYEPEQRDSHNWILDSIDFTIGHHFKWMALWGANHIAKKTAKKRRKQNRQSITKRVRL